MKRTTLVCLIALTTLTMGAEKIRVNLNKQISEDSAFVVPDKTIETKMPCLTVANEKYDFTKNLLNIMSNIAVEDLDNKVFLVELKYAGAGIAINIVSKDILDLHDVNFQGDILVKNCHFVLVANDDNKELLKTYFKKVRGKSVVFERTFEKVLDILVPEPTYYKATYNERQHNVQVKEYIINNNDKLHSPKPPKTNTQPETPVDDSDAFDIDIELTEE